VHRLGDLGLGFSALFQFILLNLENVGKQGKKLMANDSYLEILGNGLGKLGKI
jgi:hypothetical protein